MGSLLFYDLETFGRSPFYDRIAQFAAIRTNDKFEIIDEPLVLYCKITPDYVPDPQASLLTGITPQETIEKGLPEARFAERIIAEFSKPGTCVLGFNSIRFDDEFIRNLFYRNFYDPYEREWQNGNSRWDVLELVRTARDLRPDGVSWPTDEDGRPRLRLEMLSAANGIGHSKAHDALSDVYATIGMARLIHDKQPRLFEYLFKIRQKKEVQKQIHLHDKTPFVLTSGVLTNEYGASALVMPLALDPLNNNCVYCYNLNYDPSMLLAGSVEEIRKRIFTPANQLEGERVQLIPVHMNKCPSISPATVLDDKLADRLGIDLARCREHYRLLKAEDLLIQKIREIFTPARSDSGSRDVDLQIYSGGFFNDRDRQRFPEIRNARPEDLLSLAAGFEDPRIPQMIWRYGFRNYPQSMPAEERKRWLSFCASRILLPPLDKAIRYADYMKWIGHYRENRDLPPASQVVVARLEEWGRTLEHEILSYG